MVALAPERRAAFWSGERILLVGKDGGVKLRSEEPVSIQRIFDLIDSMPMRRREMREKGRTP